MHYSDYRDDGEPQDHHRAEDAADASGATLLNQKKCEQHNDGQRQHETVQRRRRNANTFDCAEHGNCRRDHAVAIEQRGAAEGEQDQEIAGALASRALQGEGQQSKDSTLALIVGTHDQEDVFDRDDNDQRPENHRQNAKHVFCIERKPVLGVEALTKGVDRACSDIAEDDTERGEAQRGKPGG